MTSSADETWATLAEADPSATIRPEGLADTTPAVAALLSRPGGDLDFGDTIGTGGMGVVRLAEQPRLARTVAVKSLRRANESATQRLVEEAWVTGRLEHPNIVPIYDIAIDAQGSAHILMKRISGIQWGSVMDDADAVAARFRTHDLLGWNLRILETVCNAIHFAHSRGIVHRDLKPENVMIGEFGEVYVVDWGIAVSLDDDERLPGIETRRIAGTPRYMAPEMVQGRFAGAQTDVYLLGALLFRILAGRAPHRGWSVKEILADIASFVPELPDAPEELAGLVQQSMSADPADRGPSAEHFRQTLVVFSERRSSAALTAEADSTQEQLRTLLLATFAKARTEASEADSGVGEEEARGVRSTKGPLVSTREPDASSDRGEASSTPESVQRPTGELSRTLLDSGDDHTGIYEALAACRFGYLQALRTWPDNPAATRGLHEAVHHVARFEIANEQPRAARTLLADLETPDPDVLEALAALEGALAERQRGIRSQALDRDLRIGARTRAFFVGVLGTVWVVMALGGQYFIATPTLPMHIGYSIAVVLGVAAFAAWARESLRATIVNRATAGLLILTPAAQVLLHVVLWLYGAEDELALVLQNFLFTVTSACGAILVDRRVAFGAIGFAIAAMLSAVQPGYGLLFTAAAVAVFTGNLLIMWIPGMPSSPTPRPDAS